MKDREVWKIIEAEERRQRQGIELIPSENYASKSVLEAMATILNAKYAEGYPGRRYYGGNRHIDEVERLCQKRALELFGIEKTDWFVNVQPYSGSPANIAAYLALAPPGSRLMGMALSSGGHLTHGAPVSYSGKLFTALAYTVDEKTGLIDFDALRAMAKQHRPTIIISGFTAYPRHVDFKTFHEIAQEFGAYHVADISHISGLIAAGLHPSPFPDWADIVTTTTHKTLRGPRGAVIFSKGEELATKIDKSVFPGLQGGPHEHVIAAKAVAFAEAATPEFKRYAAGIVKNVKAMAEELAKLGYTLVSGGTDTHLILVDLRDKGLTGQVAQDTLEQVGITVNKNTIPADPRKPWDPSGIRLGTPAITSRGFREDDCRRVARFIADALQARDEEAALRRIGEEVRTFAASFPLPGVD